MYFLNILALYIQDGNLQEAEDLKNELLFEGVPMEYIEHAMQGKQIH
jgi:hypothetical protein